LVAGHRLIVLGAAVVLDATLRAGEFALIL
jgi:hypothetical protein